MAESQAVKSDILVAMGNLAYKVIVQAQRTIFFYFNNNLFFFINVITYFVLFGALIEQTQEHVLFY